MTGRATYNDAGELRRLWKLVFGDGDRFLDSFFRNLFRPDECLVTRTDGTVTSMLFMLEAARSESKSDHPARYIYACATHPDFRRQGRMGQLLNEAVRYADEKGFELAVVPADATLFDYYRRFGFTQEAPLYRRKYPPLAAAGDSSVWERADMENGAELLGSLRTHFWKGKDAILWPGNYLEVVLGELLSQGGEFLRMKTGGGLPSGYALAVPSDGTVRIIECASAMPQDETITSLRNHYQNSATHFTLAQGVAASCAETPFALLQARKNGKAPYLNLALDI